MTKWFCDLIGIFLTFQNISLTLEVITFGDVIAVVYFKFKNSPPKLLLVLYDVLAGKYGIDHKNIFENDYLKKLDLDQSTVRKYRYAYQKHDELRQLVPGPLLFLEIVSERQTQGIGEGKRNILNRSKGTSF